MDRDRLAGSALKLVRVLGCAFLMACGLVIAEEQTRNADPAAAWSGTSSSEGAGAVASDASAREGFRREDSPRETANKNQTSTQGGRNAPKDVGVPDKSARAVAGLTIVSSNPPSCAIDARQPHEPASAVPTQGRNSIELTFSSDPSGLTPASFAVSVSPAGPPTPAILSVQALGGNIVRLTFNQRIPAGKWTKVTHTDSSTSASLGFLPGDVDGNQLTSPADLLEIIDALNGVITLPIESTDMNRSGLLEPSDYRRAVEMLNGCDAFTVWNGVALPACPSP